MEMRWYDVGIACPACRSKTTHQLTSYMADGSLMFTFRCSKCKELVRFIIFVSELQRVALMKDMEDVKPPPTSSAVAPTDVSAEDEVALPSPRLMLHQQQQWEEQMGPSWQQKGGSNR